MPVEQRHISSIIVGYYFVFPISCHFAIPDPHHFMTPEELFARWFTAPIETLSKLDSGDGAFVALMATLPLYERAIVADLKLHGQPTDDDGIKSAVETDLHIEPNVRAKFWAIFRNGFMHQGMGLSGKTRWLISAEFSLSPEIRTEGGIDYVCLNPWDFIFHVLRKFQDTPALITASESFPFATIMESKDT